MHWMMALIMLAAMPPAAAAPPATADDIVSPCIRSQRKPIWAIVRLSMAVLGPPKASIEGPFQLTGVTPIISHAITMLPVWSRQAICPAVGMGSRWYAETHAMTAADSGDTGRAKVMFE